MNVITLISEVSAASLSCLCHRREDPSLQIPVSTLTRHIRECAERFVSLRYKSEIRLCSPSEESKDDNDSSSIELDHDSYYLGAECPQPLALYHQLSAAPF
jgi:hypothetical protein